MKWKASWESDVHPEGKIVYVEDDQNLGEMAVRDIIRRRYCLPKRVIITVEKVEE